MYARIGTFQVDAENLLPAIEYFKTNTIRAFSVHEGFLGYQAYINRDRGQIVGISHWKSREALEASQESASRFLKQANELGAHIIGEPQVLEEAFDEKMLNI